MRFDLPADWRHWSRRSATGSLVTALHLLAWLLILAVVAWLAVPKAL